MQTKSLPPRPAPKSVTDNLAAGLVLICAFGLVAVGWLAPRLHLPIPSYCYLLLLLVCGLMALVNSREVLWRRVGWSLAVVAHLGLFLYRAHGAFLTDITGFLGNVLLVLLTVGVYNLVVYLSGFLQDEWYEVRGGEFHEPTPGLTRWGAAGRVESNVTDTLIHVKRRLHLPEKPTWRTWVYMALQLGSLGVVSRFLFW
jgi:hypothetical protein